MKTPTRSFAKQSLSTLRAAEAHASKLNAMAYAHPDFRAALKARGFTGQPTLRMAAKWRKLTGWPKVKKVAA